MHNLNVLNVKKGTKLLQFLNKQKITFLISSAFKNRHVIINLVHHKTIQNVGETYEHSTLVRFPNCDTKHLRTIQ